jgi:hypothetical protein
MNRFQSVAEKRQTRTAKLTALAAGRSLEEALRIAASMSPEQQKKFVEEQLARMGKTKLQFLAGTAKQALKSVKDAVMPKKEAAAFDGSLDIKDKKYDNSTPMATRIQPPPSDLKRMVNAVSNVFGVAALLLLTGGFMLGFFEKENAETITQLKPLLATFGTGAISLMLKIAASKMK